MNFPVLDNSAENASKVIEFGLECITAVSSIAKTPMFDMEGHHHHHHYCSHGKKSKNIPGNGMRGKTKLLIKKAAIFC